MAEFRKASGNYYCVLLDDGSIHRVYGNYAAHAWSVASEMFPDQKVRSVQLLLTDNKDLSVPSS